MHRSITNKRLPLLPAAPACAPAQLSREIALRARPAYAQCERPDFLPKLDRMCQSKHTVGGGYCPSCARAARKGALDT
jgi:hypothetical protein